MRSFGRAPIRQYHPFDGVWKVLRVEKDVVRSVFRVVGSPLQKKEIDNFIPRMLQLAFMIEIKQELLNQRPCCFVLNLIILENVADKNLLGACVLRDASRKFLGEVRRKQRRML